MGTDLNEKGYQQLIDENIAELEKYMPEHSLEKKHIIEVLKWSVRQLYHGGRVEKKIVGMIATSLDDFRSEVRFIEDQGENLESTMRKMVYDKTIYYPIYRVCDSRAMVYDKLLATEEAVRRKDFDELLSIVRLNVKNQNEEK